MLRCERKRANATEFYVSSFDLCKETEMRTIFDCIIVCFFVSFWVKKHNNDEGICVFITLIKWGVFQL